ncbi:hypothetical protein BpPP18_28800 [Weizmannia acidilactici]|nr:hypothetical protein BpPP18_28800 [Weizmannia acidilactici]
MNPVFVLLLYSIFSSPYLLLKKEGDNGTLTDYKSSISPYLCQLGFTLEFYGSNDEFGGIFPKTTD